jgi:hypothetical protein
MLAFSVQEYNVVKRIPKLSNLSSSKDGGQPGTIAVQSAELRDADCRIRTPERNIEVLRRAAAFLAQNHLPGRATARPWLAADRIPAMVTCRVLKIARAPVPNPEIRAHLWDTTTRSDPWCALARAATTRPWKSFFALL